MMNILKRAKPMVALMGFFYELDTFSLRCFTEPHEGLICSCCGHEIEIPVGQQMKQGLICQAPNIQQAIAIFRWMSDSIPEMKPFKEEKVVQFGNIKYS